MVLISKLPLAGPIKTEGKVRKSQECSFTILGLEEKDIAYIGDFINDLSVMDKVGFSACPSNACEEIKNISDLTIELKGGQGVLWAFVKVLLKEQGSYEDALKDYLERN